MLDLGWTELMVIGVVALIVVGPKDLPGMFRAVGNFVGKAKRMAREFSQAMNDAADDAGVSDVKKTLDAASNPMKSAMNEVRKSTDSFTKATMESGKPRLSPERQEAADKIREKSAEIARERQAKEKAEAAAQAEQAADEETKSTAPAGAAAPATQPDVSESAQGPAEASPAAKVAEDKA